MLHKGRGEERGRKQQQAVFCHVAMSFSRHCRPIPPASPGMPLFLPSFLLLLIQMDGGGRRWWHDGMVVGGGWVQ